MKIDATSNFWPASRSAVSSSSSPAQATSFAKILSTSDAITSVSEPPEVVPSTRPFDFNHMTPEQLRAKTGELTSQGLLNMDDMTNLFGWGFRDSPLAKVDYDGLPAVGSDQPMDVLAEMASTIGFHRQIGDHQRADSLQRTLDILTGLQNHLPVDQHV
ncbi:TPA: hypothetical protein SMR47_000690 [Pseudomonas putida]|nr:hypothetical protein [Pseudomonas putida]